MTDASDGDRRHLVWQLLRESAEPLTIAQLAGRLGLHPNTVRFHLAALRRSGRVEVAPAAPAGPGRPPERFRVTPGMDPAGPRHYLLLARILADGLAGEPDGPARAVAAGRVWGGGLAAQTPDDGRPPIDRLVPLLAELGFAPETPSPGDDLVRLRHCPFLELARIRPGVVCAIHQGLMQGALAAWAAPVAVDRLTPFVEPDLCTAHLSAAA